ncbi:hypothetical protein SARC_12809 [Sphaeroforma arctica JP610]|uniref:Uncharacterized protein n=1 Tax=Sphaeroforma arctica JP610 TaxID=667725 RepID=A0A0L0FD25_9EUKA|nr:hypothetical protein SARC_12809 [Sphaeroforma arctica JP610]KNC74652.1 hypothetical protein SARC_12809 [Sphaeroforma arctica JP610]|eukprot:XP_014148554.1 hypothetical protein SARC_12809 [Sphaeroforma arctica JP610]
MPSTTTQTTNNVNDTNTKTFTESATETLNKAVAGAQELAQTGYEKAVDAVSGPKPVEQKAADNVTEARKSVSDNIEDAKVSAKNVKEDLSTKGDKMANTLEGEYNKATSGDKNVEQKAADYIAAKRNGEYSAEDAKVDTKNQKEDIRNTIAKKSNEAEGEVKKATN